MMKNPVSNNNLFLVLKPVLRESGNDRDERIIDDPVRVYRSQMMIQRVSDYPVRV